MSGGLDSLVMGEGQILAQVKSVYQTGQGCPGFGRHLNGLFKQAITAGKRVRAETSISSGAVSVSSAAAELAQLKLPTHDFADSKVTPVFPPPSRLYMPPSVLFVHAEALCSFLVPLMSPSVHFAHAEALL